MLAAFATQPARELGSETWVVLELGTARVVTRDELAGAARLFVPAALLTDDERARALEAWQRSEPGSWIAP